VNISFLCLFQFNFQFKLTSTHSFRSVYLDAEMQKKKQKVEKSATATKRNGSSKNLTAATVGQNQTPDGPHRNSPMKQIPSTQTITLKQTQLGLRNINVNQQAVIGESDTIMAHNFWFFKQRKRVRQNRISTSMKQPGFFFSLF